MKKIILLSIVLIGFSGITNAQKSKLIGRWLVTKVEVGYEIQNPYQIMDYNEDGKMITMGLEVGTWSYNKKNKSIEMKSEFDKDFNGEGKILKLTDKEMVILKDGMKAFYEKIDRSQIIEENSVSGLIGTWKLTNKANPDIVQILSFKSPYDFSFVEKTDYSQSNSKGTWIFNKSEKTVILIGFLEYLKGLNKVINISSDEISLENNGTIYSLKKEETQDIKMERLTFSEKEFYDENGDYRYYNDEQKLPWKDPSKMMIYLADVKQLVYSYSSLITGTNSFETKTLTSDVNANIEEGVLSIDNIFNGYDRYNIPDDTAMQTNNYDQYNSLFPLSDDTYRVVGKEEITVAAGTFNCTVVEATGRFDEVIKLWMITNNLGILARVIKDNPDEGYGYYHIYELQEIKTTN